MNDRKTTPLVGELKAQARALRAMLAEDGVIISHSESLERIAARYGRRDWNTLRAAAAALDAAALPSTVCSVLRPGARLEGRYLRRPFSGEVVGARPLPGARMRLTVRFDAPVDVVSFDSFSSFRTRITAVIGPSWTTTEKTSDGTPHLVIERACQKAVPAGAPR